MVSEDLESDNEKEIKPLLKKKKSLIRESLEFVGKHKSGNTLEIPQPSAHKSSASIFYKLGSLTEFKVSPGSKHKA